MAKTIRAMTSVESYGDNWGKPNQKDRRRNRKKEQRDWKKFNETDEKEIDNND